MGLDRLELRNNKQGRLQREHLQRRHDQVRPLRGGHRRHGRRRIGVVGQHGQKGGKTVRAMGTLQNQNGRDIKRDAQKSGHVRSEAFMPR